MTRTKHLFMSSAGSVRILNSLPNYNIFRLVQIESICRRQNKVIVQLNFVLGRVEIIMGKGENAGYQHFLLFP